LLGLGRTLGVRQNKFENHVGTFKCLLRDLTVDSAEKSRVLQIQLQRILTLEIALRVDSLKHPQKYLSPLLSVHLGSVACLLCCIFPCSTARKPLSYSLEEQAKREGLVLSRYASAPELVKISAAASQLTSSETQTVPWILEA
jgi:hypothetical protein